MDGIFLEIKRMDEDWARFISLMSPEMAERWMLLNTSGLRFVHYTSARVAHSILTKHEIWMRNASLMNDYSEIDHGIQLIRLALVDKVGEQFRSSLDEIFPDLSSELLELAQGWEHDWRSETYLTCMSEHSASEDHDGRLSMWRAYGDVAFVMKDTPFKAITDSLAAYSMPVHYLNQDEYVERVLHWNGVLSKNRSFIEEKSRGEIAAWQFQYFTLVVLGTKHKGFSEEREWRIFYRPNAQKSSSITESLEILPDGPQLVQKIPLIDDHEKGLFSADIPSLLERVIIGPTDTPLTVRRAFVRLLEDAGVPDAREKVFISGIPLRKN